MPGPPPPPPPSMGGLKAPKSGGNPDDRGMLLQSIRQGARLKKTVTVDKSGPYIPGNSTTPASVAPSSGSSVGNGTGTKATPATMNGGPMGLGGLFAGGMPKLRPTGMGVGGGQNAASKFSCNPAPATKPVGNPLPAVRSPVSSAAPKSATTTVQKKFNQSPEKSKSPSPSITTQQQQPKSKSPSPQMEQARVPTGPSVSHLTQVLGNALMRGGEPPKPPEPRSARGPPPQPPAPSRPSLPLSTIETTITTSVLTRVQSLTTTEAAVPPVLANPPSPNISTLHANRSSLHRTNTTASTTWNTGSGGGSTLSLNKNNPVPSPTFLHNSSSTDLSDSNSNAPGKVLNYGKPNVAPKPPGIVMSPPNGQQINNDAKQPQLPKKQPGLNGRHASRSQSVRVPRSPPVTPPCPPQMGEFSNNGFAPLKVNAFHQSQDSIDRKLLPGLAKNTAPQPPLSGSRTLGRAPVRPPAHGPPPPPMRPLNQPPPPPPHRHPSPAQHTRSNSSPNTGPPQPPVRNSSMRSELDSRFSDKFRNMDSFPFPDAFLRIEKTYSSVNSAAAAVNNNIVNKQQAPMPPITQIQLTSKLWANNSSNC